MAKKINFSNLNDTFWMMIVLRLRKTQKKNSRTHVGSKSRTSPLLSFWIPKLFQQFLDDHFFDEIFLIKVD